MCNRTFQQFATATLTVLLTSTAHASDASNPDQVPKIHIVTPESVEKRLFSVDELLNSSLMTTDYFEAALDSWRGESAEVFHARWKSLLSLLDSDARSRRYEIRDQDLQRLARSRVRVPCGPGYCDGIPSISRQTLLDDTLDRSIRTCGVRVRIRDGVIHKLKLKNRGCRFTEKEYLFYSTEAERRAATFRRLHPESSD